ncbi:MAG TPA: hypothetical protein VEI02_12170, partial [Planctomycetota bacterium]|nr:hypothetical protein [Planctomycetota bacterium]
HVGGVLSDGVLRDYQRLAEEILERGLFRMVAETLAPHVRATDRHFAFEKVTFTERLLSRGRLTHASWVRRRTRPPCPAPTSAPSP